MLEEQLQAAFEESETMQKKLQQEVDQMNAQLNDLMTSNFEEEAAIRWVCLLHLLLQILHHIYIQLLLFFCYQRIKRVDTVTERLTEDFNEEMEALQVQPYTAHAHTFKGFWFYR